MHLKVSFSILLFHFFLSSEVFSQFTKQTVASNSLTDIFMIDAAVGYAGGVDGVFKTTDGGQTWVLSPYFVSTLPFGQSEYFTMLNDIHLFFLNAEVGYVVGWNAKGNYEEIIKTTDGGATWVVQHYFNPNPAAFQSIERRLKDIVVLPSGQAITIGYRGRILKTEDGGSNWTAKNSGTIKELETVTFLNNLKGLAAGNSVVSLTEDGGETWNAYENNYYIKDAYYLNDQLIIAVTLYGQILRSTDGGKTWTPDTFRYDNALNKISFVNDQTGFIVGNGIILKTTDGGGHFEKYYVSENNGLFVIGLTSIFSLADKNFYMTTSDGRVYYINGQDISFAPISTFTKSKGYICNNSGVSIDFYNHGRSDYRYQWIIDGQAVSDLYDFAYEFLDKGTHRVSLVAFNGIAYDTSSTDIQVNSTPSFTQEIFFTSLPDTLEINQQNNYNSFRVYNLQNYADYQVFRNGIAISTKIKATNVDIIRYIQFNIPTVSEAGSYEFTIVAELTNDCGVTTKQEQFNMVLLAIPDKPSNLNRYHMADNQVRLVWNDNSVQDTHYQIERRKEGDLHFEVIATKPGGFILGSQLEFYDVSSLATHQRYYYRVAAVNDYGISAYSNPVSIFIHSDIIFVNANAIGTNDGSSWENALTDISQAFNETTLDNEIWLIQGTYIPEPAEPWVVYKTGGIYGGFNGSEVKREQRNWKENKTIFSGDIAIVGDHSDNVDNIISIYNGLLSGVILRNARKEAVISNGSIADCVLENNEIGVKGLENLDISRCIIRNNKTGIRSGKYVSITNSFIYNNSYGLFASEAEADIANCLFYANPLGSIYAHYSNKPQNVAIYNYSSVFGFREGDVLFDFHNSSTTFFETLVPKDLIVGGWGSPRINYHMNYLSGDDGVLGNDDDLLYFPEPQFQNAGRIRTPGHYRFKYFQTLDYDYYYNTRVRDSQIDIGPAEFLPETIALPEIKAIQKPGAGVKLSWPRVQQEDVTRIWLERREFENEVIFIPLDPSATSYYDETAELFKVYYYSIRAQKTDLVSFPGQQVLVDTSPKVTLHANAVNYFANSLNYSYEYQAYPVLQAWLQKSVGNADNFQNVTTLFDISSNVSEYIDYTSNNTCYYRIVANIALSDISYTSTYSDIVSVTSPVNKAPVISGQVPVSIVEGNSFQMKDTYIELLDDFEFPKGITIEILPGNSYAINGDVVVPSAGFKGDLYINISVTDGDLSSESFSFLLEVLENQAPVIKGQTVSEIIQGDHFHVSVDALTISDDHNFPSGIALEILPGNNYAILNGKVVPPNDFSGQMEINVRISDGYRFSEPYKFLLSVLDNQKPIVTSQSTVKVVQGDPFKISPDVLSVSDDYNFPSGIKLEIMPGDQYTFLDDTVFPSNHFIGDLHVNIRISDGHQFSDPYKFRINVLQRLSGNFSANKTTIVENSTVNFFSESMEGIATKWQWYFEGGTPSFSNIPNPPAILYPQSGTFKVELVLEDGIQQVSILKHGYIVVEKLITDIEDNWDSGFSVFPNPSTGEVYIKCKKGLNNNNNNISITDHLGKSIEVSAMRGDNFTTRINLPKGQYIIMIPIDGKIIYKKVTVL